MELYPLKFAPVYKERVWGGDKIASEMNRIVPQNKAIGESWELSAVTGDLSKVSNGVLKGNTIQELIEIYMGDLVGDKVYSQFGLELPLLYKLIDSTDKLSVQVHPNNELAAERHQAYGKTEMWYVIAAEPNAEIYVGFNQKITKEQYITHVKNGTLLEVLHTEKAKVGDVFFLPAGRIHAIGKGLLVAEIQQTSDVTYRIYDWGRELDPSTAREMHTDLAEDAIDYTFVKDYKTNYIPKLNAVNELVSCDYFITNLLELNQPMLRLYHTIDSFVVYMCLEGSAEIICNMQTETITKGETILIPASCLETQINVTGKVKILESYIK